MQNCKLVLIHTLIIAATNVLYSTTSAQDQWPRFRGPNADGVAQDDPRLPSHWSRTENVLWSADIPGWGWSSPVVWDDKVFVTSVVSDAEDENEAPKAGLYLGEGVREPSKGIHHWLVYCFDLKSGQLRWKREAHTGHPQVPRHPKSTYASETPTTDGKRIYVLFGDVGLYAYDFDGQLAWSRAIKPRKTFYDYGAAASLALHREQLFLVYDNQEDSFLAAFDTESGEPKWRTDRDEKSTWATPFVWQNEFRTEIVVCGKNRNRAYDLSGNLVWEFDGNMSGLVIPSPFAAEDLLFITSGYVGDRHRPVFAIRPGAQGDISLKEEQTANDSIAWYLPKAGPYNPSPLVYQGLYYTLFDRGYATCHNAPTGKEVYGRTSFARHSSFTASPWAYNGKVFFLSEAGDTYVVQAGPKFELLATNSLDELCIATPSISQGKLLIRTASKLFCISDSEGL